MENYNVKLLHSTKQQSPDDPAQLAFSITDDAGNEQIVTAEVPTNELFAICEAQKWTSTPSRKMYRRMAA